LESYEERRKKEREAEEEELRKLKEKQERRRLEREQEELEMAEKRRKDDERRKEEEVNPQTSKFMLLKASLAPIDFIDFQRYISSRNFVIPTRTEKNDKFGNIVQAKQEMGMTKEQQEEAKKVFMIGIRQSIPEASSIAAEDLKAKIKELHQRICKLETSKYDLEKRHERQEYDLKELNERSRQVARNASGGKKGEQDGDGRYPPKVQVFSKYDRQIDRRNFKERRSVYENKNAYPCFPGVPPPPALFEKIFKKYEYELREEEEV
uniref:Troponin T n=1 Tax=Haemonchus placei TaxID=6290 RepID=A0A0N4W679_HAEPC